MLDENLPSFQFRPSSDNPDSSILNFAQNGSEPTPEYVFKRADPVSQPACRGHYAAALVDPYSPGVVYGEVLVAPEWSQPTLSAAEIRAQNGAAAAGAAAAPSIPLVPDVFAVQLYDPDHSIAFKMVAGSSWGKSGAWEFEMPSRSFRMPSASQLDRQQADVAAVSDLAPKVMFKWKRDGRLSKDMTCYMAGRSLGRHKSKEPDITIAFLKQGRDPALTIYEPNLRRVDVEDRKGLDLVLLLGAAVIRDLYLVPRQDLFNLTTDAAGGGARLRKNSRPPLPPSGNSSGGGGPVMSGAIANNTLSNSISAAAAVARPPSPPTTAPPGRVNTGPASQAEIDAETARLKAMVEQEEREADERARREAEEQRRIQKMVEQEEQGERQRREAEIAAETERLKQMYGTEGQDLPSTRPNLPPRPAGDGRPGSAGASSSAQPSLSSWWRGGGTQQQLQPQAGQHSTAFNMGNRISTNPYVNNAAASVSGFFGRERDRREQDGKKVRKKGSVHF